MPDREPGHLSLGPGGKIAYHRTPGKSPGVVFLTGFMSDMTGTKALHLQDRCAERGQAFLRFDYRGHGASSGAFADHCIGDWAEDAVTVLDRLTEGPQILVGSSMGGWIMLLAALARPARVAGLIGIAPAPDFTEELIWGNMPAAERDILLNDGRLEQPSDHGPDPYIITRKLIEDGRGRCLLGGRIALDCPVRLLHGMRDADVPWRTSPRLADALSGEDVRIELIKQGDHRLSDPGALDRLSRVLDELSDRAVP